MKIIKVQDCSQCPYNHKNLYCNKADWLLDTYDEIPEWCPLPDAPNYKEVGMVEGASWTHHGEPLLIERKEKD